MKILHTSDWHLGRSLYRRKRYEEFLAFLDWLVKTIEDENIDALLVAGDIFDTSTPSNQAQELYYRFLCRVAASCCRHVVVIAGNHDSPSFLNAPKELLRALNVYVVGSMTESLEDEVIVLSINEVPEAIVCAVPYLRDKDIRTVDAGETIDDKNVKLIEGLKNHYTAVCKIAEDKRLEFKDLGYGGIPIIAMGHLFTAGGKVVEADGVRDLYVGSLAHASPEIFPSSIDYLALGHLHVPQIVGNLEHMRYCGSPIPMGFGESLQQKQVLVVDFINQESIAQQPISQKSMAQQSEVKIIPVPCFQELVRVKGSLDIILEALAELKNKKSLAWLEIEYSGKEVVPNLRDIFNEAIKGSGMEILRIKNKLVLDRFINMVSKEETLEDLNPEDVFERCLNAFDIPDEERQELTGAYNEILRDLLEDDLHAE